MSSEPRHYPVLLEETLEYLAVKPEGIYVDVTAGLGGDTGAIAERLTRGFVISCDRDEESLEIAKRNTERYAERIRFHHGEFSTLDAALMANGVGEVDGIVAD